MTFLPAVSVSLGPILVFWEGWVQTVLRCEGHVHGMVSGRVDMRNLSHRVLCNLRCWDAIWNKHALGVLFEERGFQVNGFWVSFCQGVKLAFQLLDICVVSKGGEDLDNVTTRTVLAASVGIWFSCRCGAG